MPTSRRNCRPVSVAGIGKGRSRRKCGTTGKRYEGREETHLCCSVRRCVRGLYRAKVNARGRPVLVCGRRDRERSVGARARADENGTRLHRDSVGRRWKTNARAVARAKLKENRIKRKHYVTFGLNLVDPNIYNGWGGAFVG